MSREFFFFFRSLWGRNESRIRNKLEIFTTELCNGEYEERERERERRSDF